MTDKRLAAEFERLRAAYKDGFLVVDTRAFEEFCFANSDEIARLLRKGAHRGRKAKD